jgi:hypothetical protein
MCVLPNSMAADRSQSFLVLGFVISSGCSIARVDDYFGKGTVGVHIEDVGDCGFRCETGEWVVIVVLRWSLRRSMFNAVGWWHVGDRCVGRPRG